ncbi:MAG: ferrous iron transport protein A [Treponema sp.]|nr:ferrous iron transport protein A [Treponema sp.]
MMPLSFAKVGEENIIRKITGNDEVRRHLENLGFVAGANVSIVNSLAGNVIVKVKDSRVAINEDMARRIMI